MINFVLLILYATLQIVLAETNEVDPIIKIPNGYIRGRSVKSLHKKTFYAFLEVPYATPPTGDLRFKEAKPPKNWDGILNTTKNTKICMETFPTKKQLKSTESEDCLYLNVYIPKLPTLHSELLPVMVYIYGGQFAYNDGTFERYNPQLFVEEGVISVISNYRQGPLGYLTTSDGVIPANLGFKDQVAVLKWIQNNIRFFGGDPSKVTLMGQSSGATAVGYHVISKRSRGLFRSAIIQSATALMPKSIMSKAKAKHSAYELGKKLSSNFTYSNSSLDLYKLLQRQSADDISKNVPKIASNSILTTMFDMDWGPVLEDEHNEDSFITGPMHDDLRDGNFNRVPLLIGVTSEEILWYIEQGKMDTWGPYFDRNSTEMLRDDLNVAPGDRYALSEQLKRIYTNTSFGSNRVPVIRFLSDYQFRVPTIRHADLQSKFVDVYVYQFSYYGKKSEAKRHTHPVNIEGMGNAAHAEDLKYLLYIKNDDNLNFPESDMLTSQRLVRLWTNFIKHSNPTPAKDILIQNVMWPKIQDKFVYLDINYNLTVLEGYPREYGKWIPLIEKYYQHPLFTL